VCQATAFGSKFVGSIKVEIETLNVYSHGLQLSFGVAMTGDGGFLMCLGELKTAVETKANVTIIVFNDGRLSLIDIKREDRQMPDLDLSWTAPDFAAVARGFGFAAWQVEQDAELMPALNAAASASGPRLIDIRIDASPYREQLRALRG